MERRKLFATAVAVVGLAIGLWWCRGSSPDSGDRSRDHGGSGQGGSLLRRKPNKDAATASLSGRVTRKENGAGMGGAVVTIAADGVARQFETTDELPILVVANAAGEWSTPISPGTYVVAATARGFLPDLRSEVSVRSQERKTVDIALEAGGTIVRGTVADVGGGAIGNARITARPNQFPRSDLATVSKGDGTYELTLPIGTYSFTVQHDDYVNEERRISLGERGTTVEDFVLVPGAIIRGHVIAADTNQPVPDAEVRGRSTRSAYWNGSTRSDESGAFTLRGVSSGLVEIDAVAKGYASVKATVVTVGVAEQIEARVVVGHAFSISGRVVVKGKPSNGIRDVNVRADPLYRERQPLTLAPTDAEGRFMIVGVMPGFYALETTGNAAINTSYMTGHGLELVDRDVEGVVIELDLGVRVAGRLEPPAKGRISTSAEDSSVCGGDEAVADESGRFVIEHLRVGKCVIVARTNDGRGGKLDVTLGANDVSDVVIKLDTLTSVTGRVVDTEGRGVARIRIGISRWGALGSGDPDTVSNSDGSFRFDGIAPGKLTLVAIANDSQDGSQQLEVVAGTQTKDVTITVQSRDKVLRGIVTRDGKPVPDARVTATREGEYGTRWGVRAVTGAGGTFKIERLQEASYNLIADDPRDTARAEAANVKTGTSTTLALTTSGSLSGRVTVDGAPLRTFNFSCWNRGSQGHVGQRFETADGTFTLDRVPPGDYTCTAVSIVGRAHDKVTVSSDPAKLDLTIEKWGSVSGTLVDVISGAPVVDKYVYSDGQISQEDIRAGRNRPTDASGRFMVPSLYPGRIALAVVSRDWNEWARVRPELNVEAGQHLDLGRVEVVTPFPHTPGQLGLAGRVENNALVITEVTAGGPAERAGIRIGDTITTFDGRSMAKLFPHLADLLVAGQTYVLGTARGPVNITAARRAN